MDDCTLDSFPLCFSPFLNELIREYHEISISVKSQKGYQKGYHRSIKNAMGNKIKILRDELVYDGRFIQVIARHFVDRKGKEQVWEVVSRKTHGDVAAIAAITKDKNIILEKIFRVPLDIHVLELPAGLMDKKGESEQEMIQRELLEETGYKVEHVEELMRGPFAAGLRDDQMIIYLGTNAHLVQKPQLESAEDIEVIKVPLDKLFNYLSAQKKTRVDLKIASIIPYLEKRGLI